MKLNTNSKLLMRIKKKTIPPCQMFPNFFFRHCDINDKYSRFALFCLKWFFVCFYFYVFRADDCVEKWREQLSKTWVGGSWPSLAQSSLSARYICMPIGGGIFCFKRNYQRYKNTKKLVKKLWKKIYYLLMNKISRKKIHMYASTTIL